MSSFYQIQLRRYALDHGFTGRGRPLQNGDDPANTQNIDPNSTFTEVSDAVIFDITPTMSETRGVIYTNAPLFGPASIVVYGGTEGRQFSISAKFVSRTVQEAAANFLYCNTLRSWQLPHGTRDKQDSTSRTGSPPIIRLHGYKNQFFNIPTVISSLSIAFPDDVDYIETDIAMVPIIQTVELTLLESHDITQIGEITLGDDSRSIGEFNLDLFKKGELPGY